MKIETKYNIGDEVWFKHNNSAKSSKIIKIEITVEISMDNTYIDENTWYSLSNYHYCHTERTLFPTKEELLKSL